MKDPSATLTLIAPPDGSRFRAGEPFYVKAVAALSAVSDEFLFFLSIQCDEHGDSKGQKFGPSQTTLSLTLEGQWSLSGNPGDTLKLNVKVTWGGLVGEVLAEETRTYQVWTSP